MDKLVIVSFSVLCFVLLCIYQWSTFRGLRSKREDGQPTPLGFWLVEEEQSAVNDKYSISKQSHSDWWNNRFLSKDALEMSELGRRLFIYEKKTEDPGENKIKGDYDKNKIEDNQDKNKTHFKILVWRFGNWAKRKYVNGYTSKENDVFATCEVRNCEFFYEDEKILEADAVLFYLHKSWTRINHVLDVVALPRKPDQRWVYLSDESQWNSALYPHYEGLFNWTMTFHSHSDVPVPYGRIVKATDPGAPTDYYSTKPLLAAILQSHCGGDSGRFDYLDELVNHMKVDVWGKCGARYNQSFPCPGWAKECEGLTKYKFYLSFENTLCSEYITEKLWWNALARHSVPVVLGGKSQRDYWKYLPPHSYINVEDFENPKDLAEYLKFLDKDAKEYNKYHQWRQDYTALQEHGYFGTQAGHYCRLCEALNYNSKQTKTVRSLQHFFGKENCRKPFIDKRGLKII